MPGNEWKTVFGIPYSYHKYTVVLFGLVIAPAAFQGPINNVLHKYLDQFCIAYHDNIVVYLNFLEEHREHVRLVLAKLHEAGLYLKLSKCKFNMQQISFVGFIVTPEGVKMEPDRICTIVEWPEPASYRII
jgi:hypothetical protein